MTWSSTTHHPGPYPGQILFKKSKLTCKQAERVGEGIVIEFNNKILFGFDESKLTGEALTSLGKLEEILKTYPDTDIEIQGHTDDKGSLKYNQKLSERRASAVSSNLKANGITSDRLTIKGFGETLPKYTNKTNEGNAQNRRSLKYGQDCNIL